MPLMRIDMPKGRERAEIRKIMDIGYEVAKDTLKIPEGDRYQIVTLHDENEMIFEDTGLGFKRSKNIICFSLTSRPRTKQQKLDFYKLLVDRLHNELNIEPCDIMINFIINGDDDWSFAFGKAQFITGELK